MPPVPPASGAFHAQSGSLSLWLWDSVRFAGSYLVWGLMISLVAVAACTCCGYGLYMAHLRRIPPVRHRRVPGPSPETRLLAEVDRGVAELEAYLVAHAPRERP